VDFEKEPHLWVRREVIQHAASIHRVFQKKDNAGVRGKAPGYLLPSWRVRGGKTGAATSAVLGWQLTKLERGGREQPAREAAMRTHATTKKTSKKREGSLPSVEFHTFSKRLH